MRTLRNILIIGMSICTLSSCGDDQDAPTPTLKFTLSTESIQVPQEGGTYTVNVTVETSSATVEWKTSTDNEWITVNAEGTSTKQGTVKINVAKNAEDARTGSVLIINSRTQTRKSITITQDAAEKAPVNSDIKGPDGYNLVWNDEFDGNSINTSMWTFENWRAYRVNNELQDYPAGGKTPKGTKTAFVSDGTLKIVCLKEDGKIYSARMYGNKAKGFKYCYIEASMKLPKGKGTWPAFWMMPSAGGSWPSCGEIDIMEEVGYQPNRIYSTIHCTKYNNTGTKTEGGNRLVSGAQTDFHKYAMEWTPNYMKFYVDDALLHTYNNEKTEAAWPFDKAFYPILNLAWGGDWGGAQGVDETSLPATFEIDYVRVFQKP